MVLALERLGPLDEFVHLALESAIVYPLQGRAEVPIVLEPEDRREVVDGSHPFEE